MIEVKISPRQLAKLEAEIKEFTRKSGVAVAETVAIIGHEAAKELASKIQPWGMSQAVGTKYELNILKQVQKAARWANYKGTQGDIASVHSQYRNRRGSVTVRPPRTFQPKSQIIDKQEILNYAKQKQENAGIAKSGWVAAGESIDSPLLKTKRGKFKRMKGVAKWIRRHASDKTGEARMIKRQLISSSVLLTNKVDYAYASGSPNRGYVEKSIATGYRKSVNAIRKLIKSLK
jgi:hypothetical protein